jgi:UDP-N-acetylglucosamine--N-acetylmuramyl-(pentapeptide) pyrophosphoryl-undecaprenol N-acetylglucosamine transferase
MTIRSLHSVMISGGGTGGHIFPALAIGQAIKDRFPSADILFVGAKGKMEMEKVPEAGFPIVGLWISGLQRKLSASNILFPFKVLASLWKAGALLRKFKPQVVIGVGGYASAPLLRAASSRGIPCLIQEQNSYAGLTNKWLSSKVDRICVAYEGMEKYFPASKLVMTGNPVRKDLLKPLPPKEEARKNLGLKPDMPTLLVLGGSMGARSMNNAMKGQLATLAQAEVQVLWQTGKLYVAEMLEAWEEAGSPAHISARAFIKDMPSAYAAADVIISRAGALSISELCVVAKPAILVPSPNVAEDHQTKNAKALADRGAAVLVPDRDAAQEMVPKALELLVMDGERARLSEEIRKLARPDATEAIVQEILKLLK